MTLKERTLALLFALVEEGKLDKVAGVHDITPEEADYIAYRLHYQEHAGEIRRREDSSFVYFDLWDSEPELYKPSHVSLWLLLANIK